MMFGREALFLLGREARADPYAKSTRQPFRAGHRTAEKSRNERNERENGKEAKGFLRFQQAPAQNFRDAIYSRGTAPPRRYPRG